jgi:hypothetical protein
LKPKAEGLLCFRIHQAINYSLFVKKLLQTHLAG